MMDTIDGAVEAIVFASPKPISLSEIVELLEEEQAVTTQEVRDSVLRLQAFYEARQGGICLRLFGGVEVQFQTSDPFQPLMQRMFSRRPRPLSRAAQETLAIIAYRQPVTRADIEFIRGVDAGSILKNLLERDLVQCVGRKDEAGRPLLFGTTEEFLRVYGLSHLSELMPIESFQPERDKVEKALDRLDAFEESQGSGSDEETPSDTEPEMIF